MYVHVLWFWTLIVCYCFAPHECYCTRYEPVHEAYTCKYMYICMYMYHLIIHNVHVSPQTGVNRQGSLNYAMWCMHTWPCMAKQLSRDLNYDHYTLLPNLLSFHTNSDMCTYEYLPSRNHWIRKLNTILNLFTLHFKKPCEPHDLDLGRCWSMWYTQL
jgi:hypothetical protein